MTKKRTESKTNSTVSSTATPGEFAYEGLDRVIHEKARLGILTSLMNWPDGLVFGELRTLCSLTDGNLNRHLQALNEAGLIEIWKGQREKYPQTLVRLTKLGRTRFVEYIQELERVVSNAALAKTKTSRSEGVIASALQKLKPKTT